MDFKHFSHPHNLSFHQMPPGTEALCSGCNLPGLAAVYMCWQCQFFLHEQCFQAARSLIDHPSHPSHPLALLPYPTYPSATFYCNSCTHLGTGFSYTCPACDFDLHLHCAAAASAAAAQLPYPNDQSNQTPHFSPQYPHNSPGLFSTHQPALSSTPSCSGVGSGGGAPAGVVLSSGGKKPPQPRGVKHFSHQHPLNFCEVKEGDKIACSGCEKPIWGSAYSCGQTRCKFTLHNQCFGLPRKLQHKSHPDHPLALLTSSPYKPNGTGVPFCCDACLSAGSAFLYHCSDCNFDLHIDCAFLPETVKPQNHDHPLSLIYSLPDFKEQQGLDPTCDVCLGKVDVQRSWFYCCQECDYGTHLECLNGKAAGPREQASEQDLIAAAVLQLQMLQLQSQLNALSQQGGGLKY